MRAGETIEVTVSHVTPEGDGLAWVGDVEVHVRGVHPGERARVHVDNVSKHHPRAHARLIERLTLSSARRDAPCPRDLAAGGRCMGCPISTLTPDGQREAKRRMLLERYGLSIEGFVHGTSRGYRASSKRVVFGSVGRVRLGSYMRGSHAMADMLGCLVDHPAIRDAADAIARLAGENAVVPFDERTGEGDLRYVWLKTNGTDVLVTLVTAHAESAAVRVLAPILPVHGVAHAVQPSLGNVVRGEALRTVRGADHLVVKVAGVTANVGPLGFLQPNPDVAGKAYLDLVAAADGSKLSGALALDLYAGAGITTALLRRSFERVVPCESYPESALALGIEPSTVEAFLAPIVEDANHPLRKAELVVANPPRGGLGDAAAMLAALAPPRLHVMSCHPDALARDLSVLTAPSGPYRLARLVAYDTLPETAHVELVAHLELRGD